MFQCFVVMWPSLPPWDHSWQRRLCVQISEGGEAALLSSQEEKGPSPGQREPEGPEWEQQGPTTENSEPRQRTGKTWRGGAQRDGPFCEPQVQKASPNTGAHQTSRSLESHRNSLTWLWAGNSEKRVLVLISKPPPLPSLWPSFLVIVSYLQGRLLPCAGSSHVLHLIMDILEH